MGYVDGSLPRQTDEIATLTVRIRAGEPPANLPVNGLALPASPVGKGDYRGKGRVPSTSSVSVSTGYPTRVELKINNTGYTGTRHGEAASCQEGADAQSDIRVPNDVRSGWKPTTGSRSGDGHVTDTRVAHASVVVLDPIELRVVRVITFRSHYRAGVELRALVAADKPTAIVLPDPVPRVLRTLDVVGQLRGIPIVNLLDDGRPGSQEDAPVSAELVRRVEHSLRDVPNLDGQPWSVFGLAPIPLLMVLGREVGDIVGTRIFQKHRVPDTWEWLPCAGVGPHFRLSSPDVLGAASDAVLLLSVSGRVSQDAIPDPLLSAPRWEVAATAPDCSFIRSEEQLNEFGAAVRGVLENISSAHGQGVRVHVMPALPVSAAIEFGRRLLPKVDPALSVYDNHRVNGGMTFALELLSARDSGTA